MMRHRGASWWVCAAAVALFAGGCGPTGPTGGPDGGTSDRLPPSDGGDGGDADGGDGGSTVDPRLELTEGDPLPAPSALFGSGQGLSSDVRDASYDLGGNLWATDRSRLYLLRSGAGAFESFTESDGLKGYPLLSVSGSLAGRAYVGYEGIGGSNDDPAWQRETGGASRVTLDGADIRTLHYRFEAGPGVYPKYPDGRYMLRSCFRTYATKVGRYMGEAWFGCNHGVAVVSNAYGVIEHHHPTFCEWDPVRGDCSVRVGNVPAFAFGPGGRMWFGGTYGVGAVEYDDGHAGEFWGPEPVRNEKLWDSPLSPNSLGSVDVKAIAVAPDGTSWVGSAHSGLAHRRDDGSVEIYQEADGLPSNRIEDLALDAEGGLWVATTSAGVFRLDISTGEWRRATGLPSGLAQRVVAEPTPEGPAVVVTVRGGIAVYRPPFAP